MADPFDRLTARLADYSSLESLAYLLAWDQRTMMPPGGTAHRSEHLALLERLGHQTLTDPEIGRLLDELEPRGASLDPDSREAATIRVAPPDYPQRGQGPPDPPAGEA